jgi:hypothetical protein
MARPDNVVTVAIAVLDDEASATFMLTPAGVVFKLGSPS